MSSRLGPRSPRSPLATGVVAPENESASHHFNQFCVANTFHVSLKQIVVCQQLLIILFSDFDISACNAAVVFRAPSTHSKNCVMHWS